jgi:hypothetical protein
MKSLQVCIIFWIYCVFSYRTLRFNNAKDKFSTITKHIRTPTKMYLQKFAQSRENGQYLDDDGLEEDMERNEGFEVLPLQPRDPRKVNE